MHLLPQSLKDLVSELEKLPGVGEKTALRYALSLLKDKNARVHNLTTALDSSAKVISTCSTCFFWTEESHCHLCENTQRKNHTLCLVGEAADVLSIERFKPRPWSYHVLQGLLSPLHGVGPKQIRVAELLKRLADGDMIKEIIFALDATLEGDATSLMLKELINDHFPTVKLTRISQGVPVGSSVEYLDANTLESALNNRIAMI